MQYHVPEDLNHQLHCYKKLTKYRLCLCCETKHAISWSPVIILFKKGEFYANSDGTKVKCNNNKISLVQKEKVIMNIEFNAIQVS